MSEELKAAQARIACLEGEIAKRDARIAELKDQAFKRDGRARERDTEILGLRAELAAIKAQEPVAIEFRQFMTSVVTGAGLLSCGKQSKGLAAELSATAYKYLLGEPVSEAKAQGVVMPERWNVPRPMWKDARQPYGNPLNHADIEAAEKFNLALDEVARLNATPVQQVSVPDGWRLVPVEPNEAIRDAMDLLCDDLSAFDDSDAFWSYLIAAAPAAPAADAWIQVSERLPDSGSTVIAYYLNSYGKGRTIRAQHVEAWTIEAEDVADVDTDCVEYSEQDDCYYLLQGWYECIDNWDEYYRVAVTEGPITHWMPLPAAPIKIEANRHDK